MPRQALVEGAGTVRFCLEQPLLKKSAPRRVVMNRRPFRDVWHFIQGGSVVKED